MRAVTRPFSPRSLTYPWVHADPRVDDLQQRIEALVGVNLAAPRRELFARVWALAHEAAGASAEQYVAPDVPARATIPYLNEPWYC